MALTKDKLKALIVAGLFDEQDGYGVYLGVCYGVTTAVDIPIQMPYPMSGEPTVTLNGYESYTGWAVYNGAYIEAPSWSVITNRGDTRHFMIRLSGFPPGTFEVGKTYECRGMWHATI